MCLSAALFPDRLRNSQLGSRSCTAELCACLWFILAVVLDITARVVYWTTECNKADHAAIELYIEM